MRKDNKKNQEEGRKQTEQTVKAAGNTARRERQKQRME